MKVNKYIGRRACACWRPAAFIIDQGHGDSTQTMVLCLRCADALVGGLGEVMDEHGEEIKTVDSEWRPPPQKG